MWIVKIGGSLCGTAELDHWVARLAGLRATRVIVVPGGGPFADAIRALQPRLGLDDALAHRLAVLSMAQYGALIASRRPGLPAVESLAMLPVAAPGAAVWLPCPADIRRMDDLPADWSVTSDSIALWLAMRCHAHALLLVKSCPPPEGPLGAWAADAYVDPHFPAHYARSALPAYWLLAGEHARFDDAWAASPPSDRLLM